MHGHHKKGQQKRIPNTSISGNVALKEDLDKHSTKDQPSPHLKKWNEEQHIQ